VPSSEDDKPRIRSIRIEISQRDFEKRTVQLAWASEFPVERFFGVAGIAHEVLEFTSGAVDLSRLNNGGAVLVDHNFCDQVGVVEEASVDADKICRAHEFVSASPVMLRKFFKTCWMASNAPIFCSMPTRPRE
jgi:hypothetical protein